MKSSKIFAHCPNCNYVFPIRSISLEEGSQITLKNTWERCPVCGHAANILDGTYKFNPEGIATLLSGPEFTVDLLKQIAKLLETAKEENYDKERVVKEVTKLSPAFAFLIEGLPKGVMDILAIIALFLTAIQTVLAIKAAYSPQQTTAPVQVQGPTYNITNNYQKEEVKEAPRGTNFTPPKKKRKKKR